MLASARIIALDFDGTIVESVGIKDKAFESLFSGYESHWDKIWQYHKSHDAVIRFEKFRHISENILGESYTKEREENWCREFRSLVIDALVKCPYVKGATDFLARWKGSLPIYLLSISPEDELNEVLRKRGLDEAFDRVFAHPWKKVDALRLLMQERQLKADEMIFIGDSPDDYAASHTVGVPFIGRFSGKGFPSEVRCVEDLTELIDE